MRGSSRSRFAANESVREPASAHLHLGFRLALDGQSRGQAADRAQLENVQANQEIKNGVDRDIVQLIGAGVWRPQ